MFLAVQANCDLSTMGDGKAISSNVEALQMFLSWKIQIAF